VHRIRSAASPGPALAKAAHASEASEFLNS
jgi:hypothetical protein